MKTLKILGEGAAKVVVEVDGYAMATSRDPYDANWLKCSVVVEFGRFRGAVDASFGTQDFARLAIELGEVLGGTSRKAGFRTLEEALSLEVEIDRAGRAKVTGQLREIEATGCALSFVFDSDLSCLEQTNKELRCIVSEYPERFVDGAG